MREIKFRAKRIDMDRWVYGQYFKTPLSDENSGTTPDAGWFFLTGETRHCIVQDHVAFVIDEKTLGQYTGYKDALDNELWFGDSVKIYYGHRLDSKEVINNIEDIAYLIRKIDEHGATFEVIKHES